MVPKRMMAVVAHGKGDYRLEEVDVPAPGAGEILIKIEACGVCASDVKCNHGANRFWGGGGMPAYTEPPFIPGHEFLGEIVALGDAVEGFALGDRIVSEQIVPCGVCRYCQTGDYYMCRQNDVYGFRTRVNGGMAEYALLPRTARNYRVPKDIPMRSAVLIEPYACAKHCVDRSRATYDDVVVQMGVGPLGLGMIGAMRRRSPKKLIALDYKDDRLALARAMGADIALNPAKEDVSRAVMDLTDGYGCDVVIESTGHPDAVQMGLDLVRKLGRFVEFSVFSGPSTVDWSIIGDAKELDILGAHLGPYCFETVIEWIADGTLPTQGVVTHVLPLKDWEKAFEVASGGEGAIKVVIAP